MSAVDKQLIAVTRTEYGIALQTTKVLGIPFKLVDNTTLNEKLSIQPKVAPSSNQMPNMQYLVLGNKGHKFTRAEDGSDEPIPVPHSTTDASPYGIIPLALVPTNEDLPAPIQSLYCLRREESYRGVNYYAYYGLRLNYDNVNVEMLKIEVVDGVAVVTPFIPTSDNLNPVVPQMSNSGVVVGTNDNYTASAPISVYFTKDVVARIIDARRIITGASRSPIISEFCFCSGVDKQIQVTSGSASIPFTEVIACQVNLFITLIQAIGYSSDGALIKIDVGGSEPLLVADNPNNTWI